VIFSYFDTRTSKHFFLGDNSKLAEYNIKVLKTLSEKLLDRNEPKTVNILKKVKEITESTLPTLISNWSHKLDYLEEEEDGHMTTSIVPVLVNENGEKVKEDDLPPEEANLENFKLQYLRFYDDGPRGEDQYDLEGRVSFYPVSDNDSIRPTKLKVQIKCSGLSKNDLSRKCIRFLWDTNNQWIKIFVKVPDVSCGDGWKVFPAVNSFHPANCSGVYLAQLPEDERELRFRPLENPISDIYQLLILENGILEFELNIQPDAHADSDEDE